MKGNSMRYYVHAFQKEQNRVEKLVADLTDTNGELKSTLKTLKETIIEMVQSGFSFGERETRKECKQLYQFRQIR
jgi:hypothetical protein